MVEYLFHCPVCDHDFVTKSAWRRTCSAACAAAYNHAPYLFNPQSYLQRRLQFARHVAHHPDRFLRTQVQWALNSIQQYNDKGELPKANYRWLATDSETRHLLLHVVGSERAEQILNEAFAATT